jgi:hypothetical protein
LSVSPAACWLSARSLTYCEGSVFEVTTNLVGESVINTPVGEVLVATPSGAFWCGFGIAFLFLVFGWSLRLTKAIGWSGHSNPE